MDFDPDKPYNDLPLLPPKFELENRDILRKAITANTALAELKGLGASIPNQNILINSLTLQEAKHSSEIENVITTNDALYKAFTAKTSKIDPATKEVLHYREALWEGYKKVKKRRILNTNLFIELVRMIKQNQAGIRNTPGTKIANSGTGKVVYTPPEGERIIRDKLANLESWLHEEDGPDPLIKLAVIHYQFEAIHPFSDGNGRTGRLINILYLIQQDLLNYPVLYLSKYIIDHKPDYYKLLREVTEKNAWQPWIFFMLDAVEQTANSSIKRINAIRSLLDKFLRDAKKQLPDYMYSKELIELLFDQPYCKAEFLVKSNIAKRQTAASYLKELERIGILKLHKTGKENLYLNVELFEILAK
ncbi:MAG: Fic family protein [Calditrichaceae bacterium]|nr:Fic family protein [Calditrichaceae bacterium]MBN2707581.1 Fic family protein [Calditrichaceae bacterium]RQV95665.1 MAG: Fic family protein [Calditrichota bacterium]